MVSYDFHMFSLICFRMLAKLKTPHWAPRFRPAPAPTPTETTVEALMDTQKY